jgi:phage major head subunit gpT-like protein
VDITQPVLDGLRTDFHQGFEGAYQRAEVWYPKLTTQVPSGARSNTYGWLAQQLKMRKWDGPRVIQNLAEHAQVIQNFEFESTVELSRIDIRDDNLGLFSSQVIPQLGVAAKYHPQGLLVSYLQANVTAFDALSFFNTAHPTFNGAGTYSNDFTTAPLNAANFNAAWAAMASYTGEDGLPLNIRGGLLVVPPQLKLAANQVVTAQTSAFKIVGTSTTDISTAVSVDNQMQGWADVLVVDELANQPTVWYLLDATKGIMPWVFQLRESPFFTSRDNMQDPKVFDQNAFTYGANYSGNMGPTLPFLMTRNTA